MKLLSCCGISLSLALVGTSAISTASAAGENSAEKEALVSAEARAVEESTIPAAPTCSGDANNLLYPLNVPNWTFVPFFEDGASGNGPAPGPPQTMVGERNDDDSARILALGFTFDLYGDLYTSCFVNQNGNLSFVQAFNTFSSVSFPTTQFRMVAAFWGDVDTRLNPDLPGDTYQKFVDGDGDNVNDTFVVTWSNVGYYNEQHDKRNTFQIAISNGNNPLMGIGNNVCFSYDNMCWTTGSASSGVGGFGGTPATVGVNRGNGVQYFQIGRFNLNNGNYDGPYGANDGINYLDSKLFCFNTATTNTNVCPIPANFPPGDQETLGVPQAYARQLQFLSPEAGQSTTVTVTDPNGAQAAGLSIVNTAGNTATSQLSWNTDCADLGTYALTFHATDNFNPPCSTDRTLTLRVTCDDGNPCTDDSCDPATGACVHAPVSCDDFNQCTDDFCDPATGACVNTPDDTNTCGNQDPCKPERCVSGTCVMTIVDCNDNLFCTTDFCSPADGICHHVPNDAACDDGLFCTGAEMCDPNVGCVPGPAPDCNDGIGCTRDSCNEQTDSCDHVPDDAACDDHNPCTDDSCNPSTGCVHTNNTNPCDDETVCNGHEVCGGGTCNPGTPIACDDSNACTTDGCNPATGCTHTLIDCNDHSKCTNDSCNVVTGCVNTPVNCNDGNACTADGCDPNGGCTHTLIDCNDHSTCTNDSCNPATGCVNTPINCDDGNACTADSCDPVQGCTHTTITCNDADACTNDSCSSSAGCQYVPISCNDGNACTMDACNPASGCTHGAIDCNDHNKCTNDSCLPSTGCVNVPIGCDDGNACTADACDPAGGCTHTAITCNDANACTNDSCNPTSGCVYTNNTSACDDADACTSGDACSGGTCHGGAAVVCTDANPCTTDTCNPATGCVYTNNTDPCSDGNACTTGDVCGGGTCHSGATTVCNDNNPCTIDTCNPASGCVFTNSTDPCSDGNACTTGDVCGGGTCHSGATTACNDNNPCTTDTCNPASGCVFTNNTDPCSDGNACTTGDSCGGGTCHSGATTVCNDNNPCTTDTCNPASGCVYTNNTNPCDDGNACTTGDACGGGTCHPGTTVVCNDNNACTADTCNPSSGCVYTPTPGAACSDGNACTTNDACSATGTCVGGAALVCNDNNGCTTDTCNPSSGCVYTNNTNPCNDGNACTTGDVCGGGTCHPGSPTNCDDGNCCTIDACDPATGACTHTANTAPPVFTTQPSLGYCPVLWPPQHGYVDFTVTQTGAAATSSCGAVTIQFAGCNSSQPENGNGVGDGNSVRDCVYEPGALHLRAERDGACSPIGRVYTTTLIAVDACGNTAVSSPLEVGVWHDRGHEPTAGTIFHANPGSNTTDTRNGINGTYGTGCGAGSPCVNGTQHDHSDEDPEMECSQYASISVDDLRVARASSGNLSLTWTEPVPLAPINVTRYHVYRQDPLTLLWTQLAELSGGTTSFQDASLNDGRNWRYKVTALIK